ncbi:hypothetical protein DES53_108240 [Roseimicrobium gellanilyticum]|uniref:Uncharacterized protein n=2 Tax=Roseimicrobium gellanilyticum TaxID=748857 RepID=A0A366HDK9_9BACT|nr:hypothetical protein DES53_108240 [Roseimicrobium gellanilyticum]
MTECKRATCALCPAPSVGWRGPRKCKHNEVAIPLKWVVKRGEFSSAMARTFLIPAVVIFLIASTTLALATPGQIVTVEEKLLGSNPTGYITLRTEVDNLGTYYGNRTQRFLVEYSKEPSDPKQEAALGAQVQAKLLLDITTTNDATQDDPFTPEATTRKLNEKDGEVKLADLLERYPSQARKWSAENVVQLEVEPSKGLWLGSTNLAWAGWIKERFLEDRNSDLEWRLDEVYEDENCLYLSVSTEEYGQRLVSIPPRKTKQVRDQLAKQPVYLIAGHSKNKDEAIKLAQELIKKTKGKFRCEVWSSGRYAAEMIYVVADSDSSQHLARFRFEETEKLTGVDLSVMSSADFSERTEVKVSAEKE